MLTVLHADEDRELRETNADIFASRGFHVRTAGGGVDCVEKLRQFAPDLLILDLELPWGGGDGVLAVMREDLHLRQIPVVMTSAVLSVETLNRLTSPPVVSTVAKPFHLAELLDTFVRTKETGLSASDSIEDGPPDVVIHLEREIQKRTGRRVQDLRVKCVGGALFVNGRAPSYHTKQLVLVAAKNYLAGRGIEVHFDVDVE